MGKKTQMVAAFTADCIESINFPGLKRPGAAAAGWWGGANSGRLHIQKWAVIGERSAIISSWNIRETFQSLPQGKTFLSRGLVAAELCGAAVCAQCSKYK